MLQTLKYFYEVKGGDPEKAHETISIVPYCYKRAHDYYYDIWLAHQQNKDIGTNIYTPKVIEVVIPRPQCKPKKRKIFTFLDEKEVE